MIRDQIDDEFMASKTMVVSFLLEQILIPNELITSSRHEMMITETIVEQLLQSILHKNSQKKQKLTWMKKKNNKMIK